MWQTQLNREQRDCVIEKQLLPVQSVQDDSPEMLCFQCGRDQRHGWTYPMALSLPLHSPARHFQNLNFSFQVQCRIQKLRRYISSSVMSKQWNQWCQKNENPVSLVLPRNCQLPQRGYRETQNREEKEQKIEKLKIKKHTLLAFPKLF